MVWGVAGRGFRCFLPPTDTWCFQAQMTNASVLDGGAALHPVSAVPATIPIRSKRVLISIDDVKTDFHGSVFGSAENGAVPNEVTCLLRGKEHFVGLFL